MKCSLIVFIVVNLLVSSSMQDDSDSTTSSSGSMIGGNIGMAPDGTMSFSTQAGLKPLLSWFNPFSWWQSLGGKSSSR